MNIPTAPELAETSPGTIYVALGPEGLDLVVEVEDGGTVASVLWWGHGVRAVEVGKG